VGCAETGPGLKTDKAMGIASGPDSLIIPMPPWPAGVEIAAIVWFFIIKDSCATGQARRGGK
jgi:hypothetical protein